jgi:hypothetical protein
MGLFRLAAERINGLFVKLRPSVRTEIYESEKRSAEFDECFGVDTAGRIHQINLNIANPNQLHAVSYGASDPRAFGAAISALPIHYKRFVLIDYGSGKGRAILLAKEFPFKKIIGLEFSEELHRIAQHNILRYHSDTSKCNDVELICMDAVDYILPKDCLVCYFCNPFDAMIMAQVLSNIQKSFMQNPREIYIVYYNPKEGYLFDESDCFKKIRIIGNVIIWMTKC